MATDDYEEHVSSIFRVEECAEQETRANAGLFLPPTFTLAPFFAYSFALKM
jgi:hypothetical protein